MTAVGVDACKLGWVAVILESGRPPTAHLLRAIADIGYNATNAEVIGIDIPIGVPSRGPRPADLAARQILGPRRTSLFVTPVRAALEADTHAAATAVARQISGGGISQQAYALRAKIFEVEQWLDRAPCDVIEIHPEVSFTRMIGRPPRASKKSWHGQAERIAALSRAGIQLDDVRPEVGALVAADDLIDAAAAAWSAARWLAGAARPLPDPPPLDDSGRPVAIWA